MSTCTLFNSSPSKPKPKACPNEAVGQVLASAFPTLEWRDACEKHLRLFERTGNVRRNG